MKSGFDCRNQVDFTDIFFERTNKGRYGHILVKMTIGFNRDKKRFHNAIIGYHKLWLLSLKNAYQYLVQTGRIISPNDANQVIRSYGKGIIGTEITYEIYSKMTFLLRSASRRVEQYYLKTYHELPVKSYQKAVKHARKSDETLNENKLAKAIVKRMIDLYCVDSFYREYTPFRATRTREKLVGTDDHYGIPYKSTTQEIRFPEPIGNYHDNIFTKSLFNDVFDSVPFGYSFYGYSIHADLKSDTYWLSFDFKLDSGYIVDAEGFLRLQWNDKNKNVRYQAYMKNRKLSTDLGIGGELLNV